MLVLCGCCGMDVFALHFKMFIVTVSVWFPFVFILLLFLLNITFIVLLFVLLASIYSVLLSVKHNVPVLCFCFAEACASSVLIWPVLHRWHFSTLKQTTKDIGAFIRSRITWSHLTETIFHTMEEMEAHMLTQIFSQHICLEKKDPSQFTLALDCSMSGILTPTL